MWLMSVAQLLVLIAPATQPATAGMGAGVVLPKAIATRQTYFAIPFQIDRHDDPRRQATEVQLLVSTSHGARWDLCGRVEPSKGRFLFRARGDGEYWFLIRTVDRAGQVHPQRNSNPGLIVVVDTSQPVVQLDARRGDAGEITARWQVVDPHLNPSAFHIRYRTSPLEDWQTVAIDPASVAISGDTRSGQLSWWPNITAGRVEIRAEAADTAGNIAVTHAQVNFDPGPVATAKPAEAPILQAPMNGKEVPPPPTIDTSWRSAPSASGSIASAINPPIRSQYTPAGQTPAAPPVNNTFPGGVRPKMVNSRMFEINYTVNAQGSAPAGRIELWGTLDGGRTWSSFGVDDDGRSPMVVTVKQEGVYGFRMLMQNDATSRAPQPGEPPKFWIGVDLTKPAAQIVSAEPGTGDMANHLVIRWLAEDQMLAAQPITLLYSSSAGGPWMPVAVNLTDMGQYAWPLDPRLPSQVYLRLEVRDEAGNIGVFQTPNPVVLNRSAPNVLLRDVRSLNDSARIQPKRYYFR